VTPDATETTASPLQTGASLLGFRSRIAVPGHVEDHS
jgi:hypothetical protein